MSEAGSAGSAAGSVRSTAIGADGKPMSAWQVRLKRLCMVMIVWACIEIALGVMLWFAGGAVEGVEIAGVGLRAIAVAAGATAFATTVLNLVIGLLGIRGAENPSKITLFFWITLANAVLTAWALASNVSAGMFDVLGTVSGLFVIALAVCAWQVRGQTGYFDVHP